MGAFGVTLDPPVAIERDDDIALTTRLKAAARSRSNIHRPDGSPNVFVVTLPRSGSTWLMELIWSQPGFKACNEPTDIRNPLVRRHLGLSEWGALYDDASLPVLERYFAGFCSGRLGFTNPRPFRANYRPLTQRIVFKLIHGCEDRAGWFARTFNGRVCYLLRHPIAVALSREVYPTLPAMLSGPYARHFSAAQLAEGRAVARDGDKLARGVLSWCLQTAVPLRQACDDWAVVTYEQLVLEPAPTLDYLAERLALPDRARMLARLPTPSRVRHKSDLATQQMLALGASAGRERLVEKWRAQVSPADEDRVMRLLDVFEIDAYQTGSSLPGERYWIH